MKDRYLFRGKVEGNGIWVYGFLAKIWGGYHIIELEDEDTAWKVIPETVGQCAGLKDKNGELIYEGDVVTCQTRYGIDRGVVVWKDGRLRVFWDSRFRLSDKFHIKMYYEFTSHNAVVGNIHENDQEWR